MALFGLLAIVHLAACVLGCAGFAPPVVHVVLSVVCASCILIGGGFPWFDFMHGVAAAFMAGAMVHCNIPQGLAAPVWLCWDLLSCANDE